jgi:hypothetical protein
MGTKVKTEFEITYASEIDVTSSDGDHIISELASPSSYLAESNSHHVQK